MSRESINLSGPSKVQQNLKTQVDINHLVKQGLRNNGLTGHPGGNSARQPMFGDFSELPSFQESLNYVNRGKEAFNSLPSKIRKRFNHNPVEFVEFMQDENNFDEAVALGIIEKPVEPTKEPIVEDEKPA